MEVKIQKLENVINEVGKDVKEKDDKINKLQAQIRMKTDTNELTQLQDKLNATEKRLGTSLAENQRLQAKLDKGAELYKEEIEHLKTQLVKHDMERMKQSKSFDTHNELQLKEELRKWKERALKWKERSSREITRDTVPRSPRKTVPYSLKDQTPSPSKEPVSQEIAVQNISQPLPLTCPTNLFDNSSLNLQTDIQPAGVEPREQLKHWFGTSEKDKAPDCITQ
ncbi:centromere-associated protein e [Limosa lapponica baueri]|uniref:Centromere-associated protein e n=1 Tax=Limosa lapponica baueri TaxID=1758121 RepID=A0A2I0TCQ0_LIMLA|nr:centromere-associated protein e [Limosa lapponica baueri]